MRNLRTATVLVCLLIYGSRAAAQLKPRPYDPEKARRTAVAAQRLIEEIKHAEPIPGRDESGLGDLAQALVESLRLVDANATIDSEVIESLAAMAGTGGMVHGALLALGERAVPALIRSAQTHDGLSGQRKGAMDALEEMLERPTIAVGLSTVAKAAIRQLARENLNDPTLQHTEVGSAGCLAIATRDPELRATAARLLRPEELRRRAVDPLFDDWTIEVIGQALAKFPSPDIRQ